MVKSKKSYQKYVSAVLSTSLAAGAFVAVAPSVSAEEAVSFSDVKETDYFYEAVHSLVAKGVVAGFDDGTFRPNELVTRAQVAEALAKLLNLDTENVKDPGFSDVAAGDSYYGAVASLVEKGVFAKGENFNPDKNITRAEMAKVLSVAFNFVQEAYNSISFYDFSDDDWFAPYILKLVDKHVTQGKSTHEFAPFDPVTRGELATFLHRSDENKPHFVLNLMHSNDTHSHVDKSPKKATAIKEVKAAKPDALLLHAGDMLTGTLYFNEFLGQAELKFMNLLGYDIVTFGNHEFDLGSSPDGHQALADFVKGAQFPFVSSNVDFSKDAKFTGLFSDLISSEPENGKIYTGIVKEINGEKVGFFGLTTEETVDISSPGDITFKNYLDVAEKAVKAFEEMGVNKIVAVTHIGYDDNPNVDNDLILAEKVDGIDIIVGGHSHTRLDEPVIVDKNGVPTLIVQAYQYNDFLGTLDVEFDEDGKIIGYAGELIATSDKADDPDIAEALKEYASVVDEVKNTPVGVSTPVKLENPRLSDEGNTAGISVRNSETALGNLITDGMLAKAREFEPKVIMAMQNGGGIRAAIDEGEITIGEVITVLPFGNTLATMELTGKELKEAFEISLRSYPGENGGFLHVAGGKVEFDSTKPEGERVVSVAYYDEDGNLVEIKDDETYYIATNAFTAKGGDGYTVFAKAYEEGRVTDLGLADWENFRDHLKSLDKIEPKVEGRIVDVSKVEE